MLGFISIVSQAQSHASNGSCNDNSLWHLHLGHMSEKGLEILSKQGLFGNHKVEPLQFCEHYVYGKHYWTKFTVVVHTTNATLDYVYYDC